MLKAGILNPQILSLLARVRHTNSIVIADRGFPFWPGIETIDISLVDDVPTVLQVLKAIKPNFCFGEVYMAEEFLGENTSEIQKAFQDAVGQTPIKFESHEEEFKIRVPGALGLIRTGDTIQYANMILVST
jgi:D-ribose pyranase